MRIFEQTMQDQINIFLRILYKSSQSESKIINMSPRCERLAVDVIGQLAFGYQLNTQLESTHRSVVQGIKARGALITLYFFWKRLSAFDSLFLKFSGRQIFDAFRRSLGTMIATRTQLPKEAKHDFYSFTSGENGLDSKELWTEATLFIGAGGSTTATALSAALFYLSRNEDAYERLAVEIRETFDVGDNIKQGAKLAGCKFLRAVIDEALRMSPPTLAVTWRQQDPASVEAGDTFTVDGHVIPPGTQVALSNYTLQHDPRYFPDPYTFRPERWLPSASSSSNVDTAAKQDQDETLTAMRRAFIPFLIGERNCAGRPLAYLEMSLALARTIWYFDFTKAPGEAGKLGEGGQPSMSGPGRERENEFQLFEGFVVGHDGPNLVFTPRKDSRGQEVTIFA